MTDGLVIVTAEPFVVTWLVHGLTCRSDGPHALRVVIFSISSQKRRIWRLKPFIWAAAVSGD